jgi:hypothetical protein
MESAAHRTISPRHRCVLSQVAFAGTGKRAPQLIRQVRSGTARPASRLYARLIGVDLLYAAIWFAVALTSDSWWQLTLALPAVVVITRIYFIGHDAGHCQITGTRRVNRLLGLLIGNLLIGLSYGPGGGAARRPRGLAHPQPGRLFIPLLLLEGINLKVTSVRPTGTRRSAVQRGELGRVLRPGAPASTRGRRTASLTGEARVAWR